MSQHNCKISTPQHKDGKVYRYHTQEGVFDDETLKFIPNFKLFSNHEVQFQSVRRWQNSCIEPIYKSCFERFLGLFK